MKENWHAPRPLCPADAGREARRRGPGRRSGREPVRVDPVRSVKQSLVGRYSARSLGAIGRRRGARAITETLSDALELLAEKHARQRANLWLGGILAATLMIPGAAHSQTAESAYLFAYRPKPGMATRFEEGYRAHLAWHREAGDPFAWYGWYVATGDEPGVFVDGTFGPTPAEFDDRVSPAADAAHFAETTAPFADALWRRVYRSRPDLGTSRFLEERRPSAALRVLHYRLEPGKAGEFTAFLGRVVAARAAESSEAVAAGHAWAAYELVDGGTGPEFMLLLPTEGMAGVELGGPVAWLETRAGSQAGDGEVARLGIRSAISATWRFREDLTYIPEQ